MINEAYLKLGIAALLPVIAAILLELLDSKTKFSKINRKVKQVIYGVVFGILAIVGTEWGIPLQGAQVNCRDAAVIIAGLMFGGPAGIIAGLIGGIERWFAIYWGVGTFTRVACSLSTIIAGFYAAILRKRMFENRRPNGSLSMAIGVVMEVFHLTMVFITNMATPEKAMQVVKACSVPMIVANGLSAMLAALALRFLHKRNKENKKRIPTISHKIQKWLLLTVSLAFVVTSLFVYRLQNEIAIKQTDTTLNSTLNEMSQDTTDIIRTSIYKERDLLNAKKNHHVGETGYNLILDNDYRILGENKKLDLSNYQENVTELTTIDDEEVYLCYREVEGYYLVGVLPKDEALQMRNIALYVNTFMEILAFAVLFAIVYSLINNIVVKQIKSVNRSLSKITKGDLNVEVKVRSSEEFASLSDDINETVDALKQHIKEASKRIDKELALAKSIQRSALPNSFPKRQDFDFFALMKPAKEVGGDFYDFYFTKDNILHFLVADVSGKGIPGAMFMMRAKTELKSLTQTGISLSDVFTDGNTNLCQGNDAGMFVTAWQGNFDLSNGKLEFANAGHNPPLVKRGDKFEYLKVKSGFILAGMEGIKYKTQELDLQKGDVVFLYTDGVTEATNLNNELFGEERLLNAINSQEFSNMREMCNYIKKEVDAFVGEAEQFDDITMVALKYNGMDTIKTIEIENAQIKDVARVTEFVEQELEKNNCSPKAIMQIDVAIDEIYSNIVKYGYPDNPGKVIISVDFKDEYAKVTFADWGIPFNPLANEDPDISKTAEDREIGGLGIYVVKKTMDNVEYNYENGQNILTLSKKMR